MDPLEFEEDSPRRLRNLELPPSTIPVLATGFILIPKMTVVVAHVEQICGEGRADNQHCQHEVAKRSPRFIPPECNLQDCIYGHEGHYDQLSAKSAPRHTRLKALPTLRHIRSLQP